MDEEVDIHGNVIDEAYLKEENRIRSEMYLSWLAEKAFREETANPDAECETCGGCGKVRETIRSPMLRAHVNVTCPKCKGTGRWLP